jgi:lipid-binding SYLF domain-containing protein
MKRTLHSTLLLVCLFASDPAISEFNAEDAAALDKEAKEAFAEFEAKDPAVKHLLKSTFAHAVIPAITKAGFGVGGAHGKGVLYENGEVTAIVTLSQVSFGFQWGGQSYSEFLFFQDYTALTEFKTGIFELGAQVSAVAVTAGVSSNAEFYNGVAVFTQVRGGMMYEASVSGQKFNIEVKEENAK